jgi:plasmid maintenance system antidote protein VapI
MIQAFRPDGREHLRVTRKALSDVLNGDSGMSPEMALRLEKAGWSAADTWLRMQMNWSLWRVRQQARTSGSRSQLNVMDLCGFLPPRPAASRWMRDKVWCG